MPLAVVIFALGCFALSTQAAVQEVILKDIGEDPRNLCAFLQLVVNIKNMALMIGAPITALMIIIGGVLLSASAGISSQIERAKGIIKAGIIGLVIVVCAWLIVGGVITALFGRDLGSAWWTIAGCNVKDSSSSTDPDNYNDDGTPKTPSGNPDSATSNETCRDECAPLAHTWNNQDKTCTCNTSYNNPSTAKTEGACRVACLPKRYNWDNDNKRCSCSTLGSLTFDPNAEAGRLRAGGQEFLACVESFFMPPDQATVWRIGDPNTDCYNEDKWNDESCIFEKYSCHYGGHGCRGESYSIDFTNISDKGVFMAAVISCGGAPPSDKGSYIHVRFTSGCVCSDDI